MPRAWPGVRPLSNEGDLLVSRRFVTLALSCCLVLAVGITRIDRLFAQEVKKAAAPAQPPAKTEAPKTEPAKKAETAKAIELPKVIEAPLPPIPKEVEAKLEA